MIVSLCVYSVPNNSFDISDKIIPDSVLDVNLSENKVLPNSPAKNDISHSFSTNLEKIQNYDNAVEKTTRIRFDESLVYIKTLFSLNTSFGISLFIIWLLVFISLIGVHFYASLRFRLKIHASDFILDDIPELDISMDILKVTKPINVLKTNEVKTPCVYGLFKPIILLPKNMLDISNNDQLKYIILHEVAHIKRFDLLTNTILTILKFVYWFNPIVSIGISKMKDDMEIACDYHVLKHLDREMHKSYGMVLIDLVTILGRRPNNYFQANIINSSNELKRRIMMIKKYKNQSKIVTIIGLLAIALFSYTVLAIPKINTTSSTLHELPQELEDELNKLVGKNYETLFNKYGTPSVRTYYINSDDITDDNVQMPHTFTNELVYQIDDNSIYIKMKNDTVTSYRLDDFSGRPITKDTSDFVICSYSDSLNAFIDGESLNTVADPNLTELDKQYSNKSLESFTNDYNLGIASTEIYLDNLKLDIYPIAFKDSASVSIAAYVLSSEGTIKNISVGRSDIKLNSLKDSFDF